MRVVQLKKVQEFTANITAGNNKKLTDKLIPSKELPIYSKSVTDPKNEVFNHPYQK